MRITILSESALRLEATPGSLTIEAPTAETIYSPFHMLASALASCTFAVLSSWASHARLSAIDLSLQVQWRFADEPHRVSDIDVVFEWPSLPTNRLAAARRVAELCTVHATLMHPPHVSILAASERAADDHDVGSGVDSSAAADPSPDRALSSAERSKATG